MAITVWRVLLRILLGLTLLHMVTARQLNEIIVINAITQNGTTGHVVSYNYPFSHRYDVSTIYRYRVFLYDLELNPQAGLRRLCMRFRRFDLGSLGRLAFKYGTAHHWYGRDGERVGGNGISDTLPLNLWNNPFCVLVGDWRIPKGYMEVTYDPGVNNPNGNLPKRGFEFEYWHQPDHTFIDNLSVPTASSDTCAPCRGKFTCYDRKCVSRSSLCQTQYNCADHSDHSFAHARCQNNGIPFQTKDFWACDFSGGRCSPDTKFDMWVPSSGIASPAQGPQSDHTGYGSQFTDVGMFVHTRFTSFRRRAILSFEHGSLQRGQDYCLSFWYYMDGEDPGTLMVQRNDVIIWTRAGTYGAMWLRGQVPLKCDYYCSPKVKFFADVGSNMDSKISLDDVSIMPGLCPYTDVSFFSPGWTTSSRCSISTSGMLTCMNCLVCSARSPLLTGGKCLIFNVKFSNHVPMIVYQLSLHKRKKELARLYGRKGTVRIAKVKLSSLEPFQIDFELSGIEVVQNFHVVDNDCDNLAPGACFSSEFFCGEGDCIGDWLRCDGKVDCKGGSSRDEDNCSACKSSAFLCNHQCVLKSKMCNGFDDCGDHSDEANCPISGMRLVGIVFGVVAAVCVAAVTVAAFLYKRYCKRCTKSTTSSSSHSQAHRIHHPRSPMGHANSGFTPDDSRAAGTESINVNGYSHPEPPPAYAECLTPTAPPAYGVVGALPVYEEIVTGSLDETNRVPVFPHQGYEIGYGAP